MISIVVPAYNEEDGITLLYDRVTSAATAWHEDYELIVVDDGSRDGTLRIVSTLAAKDARVKVLSFTRNFGHQAAVTAGLVHAIGDIIAVIDADLQDPPEELGPRQAEGGHLQARRVSLVLSTAPVPGKHRHATRCR
jgi:glycosyltransferase involved in cell wall biosynthesis